MAKPSLLILFLAFFFFLPTYGPLHAGETVELPALLEEAREKNPELKALRERASAIKARERVVGRLDDPTLEVELEEFATEDPLDGPMQTRYNLRQMIPFPGRLRLERDMASRETLVSGSVLRARELGVAAEVKEAYFEYAFLEESIRIVKEIRELLSRMGSIAQKKYGAGTVSQQDAIKVQVEGTSLLNELIMLEAEKGVKAARLKNLLGRSQDEPLGEPGELPRESVEFDTGELISVAMEKNPEIRMLELEAEAKELGVGLARKNYYPGFMVGVAPIQREGRFESFDLMFGINIPIWRNRYSSAVEEASLDAVSLKSLAASERNLKGFEVKSAALEVEAQDRMRTVFETSLIPQVELSFESALRNYELGRIDLLTLLDTERELKRVRLEYLRAILGYRKSVAALERLVGVDLPVERGEGRNTPPERTGR